MAGTTPHQARSDRGVALTELAIYLPLLLLVLFLFIFLATTLNARSALTSAVQTVRLAFTRGQSVLVGSNAIAAVQNWKFGSGSWDALKPILATPNQEGSALAHYDNMALDTYGVSFKELPSTYIYSQIYAAQSMLQSVGALRFPCDPESPDGAGCLDCRNTPDPNSAYGEAPPEDTRSIGIICRYRPAGAIVGAVETMLNVLSGGTADSRIIIERPEILDFS